MTFNNKKNESIYFNSQLQQKLPSKNIYPLQKKPLQSYKPHFIQIPGIKLKKSSKKPIAEQTIKPAHSQQENLHFQQNTQNEKIQKISQKKNSVQPIIESENKMKEKQVSQNEKKTKSEGFTKLFPKEIDYFYSIHNSQEKFIQQCREVVKSIMIKGYSLKSLSLYLNQYKVDINSDRFFEYQEGRLKHKTLYYKEVSLILLKVIQTMQYFLEKECSLQIRKIKMAQYKQIKKDLTYYKLRFSSRHAKTIQKLFKVILHMQDVTLSENQVFALHIYIVKKIDKKQIPPSKTKDIYVSEVQIGQPYTMRNEKKYAKINKKIYNTFQQTWKHEIQKLFLDLYTQNSLIIYCTQKIKMLFPQYKNLLTTRYIKMQLQKIFRKAFRKLKYFIYKVETKSDKKLPKLTPIDNAVFRMIISMKHYQKVRFVLTRLYYQELNEQICKFFIQKMNQAMREFQAFQGLLTVRNYQVIQKYEPNVISLRPRLKRNFGLLNYVQASQDSQWSQNEEKDIQDPKPIIIEDEVSKFDNNQQQLRFADFFYQDD